MAAGRAATSSSDDVLMNEVLLRVKQELTTFNLAMREQCRQQLEAERSERIAALDEFREDCTNLRDDVRAFQVRQDKASNTIAQQRKDMESQLILLKDCLRENGGVCTEMADRLLSLQVAIEESQRNSVAPAQPDQCASVRAQSERDHWVGTLTNSAREQLSREGVTEAFTRELDEIKTTLLLEVQAARQVADAAVTADMLECKVQEILGPIQASMLMVTREIEGVVAAVDIAKRSFHAEEGPDAISVDGLKAQEDQARLLQENVRVLREMVPDGKKLKLLASQMDELRANSDIQASLAMQVDELKGSISDMRRMNIQTCDFGNDLHTAFETFREELALRISSVEATQQNHEVCIIRMKDDVDLNVSGEEWKSQEPNVIRLDDPPSVAVSCRETPATVTRTGAVHRLPSPGGPSGSRSLGPSQINSLVTSANASPQGSPHGSQSPSMIGRRPQRNSTGGLQVQKAMHSIGNYCSMRNAPGGSVASQRPLSPVPSSRPLPPKQSQGNSWVPDRGRPQATPSTSPAGSGLLPVGSRGPSPERPVLSAVSRNARGISPERLSSGPQAAVSGGTRPVGLVPGGSINAPGSAYQMGNGAMAMTMGSSASSGALPQVQNFQWPQQGAVATVMPAGYQRSGSPVAGPMRQASTVLQTSGISGFAVQRSSSPM